MTGCIQDKTLPNAARIHKTRSHISMVSSIPMPTRNSTVCRRMSKPQAIMSMDRVRCRLGSYRLFILITPRLLPRWAMSEAKMSNLQPADQHKSEPAATETLPSPPPLIPTTQRQPIEDRDIFQIHSPILLGDAFLTASTSHLTSFTCLQHRTCVNRDV